MPRGLGRPSLAPLLTASQPSTVDSLCGVSQHRGIHDRVSPIMSRSCGRPSPSPPSATRRPLEIPHGRSPEVVQDAPGHSCRLAGNFPGTSQALDRLSVAVENLRNDPVGLLHFIVLGLLCLQDGLERRGEGERPALGALRRARVRRTVRPCQSTCRHSSGRISLVSRQPVRYANVTTGCRERAAAL